MLAIGLIYLIGYVVFVPIIAAAMNLNDRISAASRNLNALSVNAFWALLLALAWPFYLLVGVSVVLTWAYQKISKDWK